MNIIDLQERLKDLPETALMQEMQAPSGTAPQFLVLSELKRRKRMRDEYQRQEAQGMQTVAEEAVTAAGAPAAGIMQMSRAMAPRSAIAQNTGVNDMMQQESVRAPQPEQPMMMADGGVLKMQPGGDVRRAVNNLLNRNRLLGGFGQNVEYNYETFLQEMGLSDTPDARDAFSRYQDRMNTQYALEGPQSDPQLFGPYDQRTMLRDIAKDRYLGPGQPSIGDVSADVGAFLPSPEGQPPSMTAPVLGAAPSVGAVDFDASVAAAPATPAAPAAEADYTGALRSYLASYRGDRGLSRPFERDPLDPRSPAMPDVSEAAVERESDGIYTDALRDYLSGFRGDRGLSRPFEADPLDPRSPGYTPPSSGFDIANLTPEQREEYESLTPEQQENFRMFGVTGIERPTPDLPQVEFAQADPLPAPRVNIPQALELYREFEQQGPNIADILSGRAATARSFEQEAQAADAAARAPRPVEDQELSFGLGAADLPTTDTDLSFGGITPSAADIPLSTGVEPSGEPTPKFPLGTPVEAPAVSTSSATGGTGGTGGGGTGGGGTGGGGTGGGGAGGYGPIESRIARMLEERERSAEADKWLALAQTGLALMASDQPTIGGAIGEAGLAGIGALQEARSQYDKDIMELLDMQAGVQRSRAAGARTRERTPAELKGALESLWSDIERLATPIYGPDPSDPTGMKQTITRYDYSSVPSDIKNDYKRLRDQYLQMFQSPVDVTS
jgi:hypothetical protein